ncbi:MAG: SH3 domain-containing protein [Deltaproteobacteria bacterium]|nr:SH3 domain-containing protein [Deltaproteobacteria bacterium]
MQRRADEDRVRALEFEIERLREDLRAAEETLLAVESGMRGSQGRAEAVSALAEARIQLERASRRAPWRDDRVREAREKLAEAERQLAANRVGSAVFFISRARRITGALDEEADRVAANASTHFIEGSRVNLRTAPSQGAEVLATLTASLPVFVEAREADWSLVRTTTGKVGFVHSSLLRKAR